MNQLDLYKIFEQFRIHREDATYPPYHEGKYLEEYFVDKFYEEYIDQNKNKSLLIPVYWTAVFNFKSSEGLSPGTKNYDLRQKLFNVINNLPKDRSYFTVSTHDDAPQGSFPPNVRHFYAGGNSMLGTDPIPLICSRINVNTDPQKLLFCSFVGSATNNIRNNALKYFYEKQGYSINAFHWNPNVSEDQQKLFLDLTSKSRFALCPRGYGATSYRLYESMQLGSIPVYISDKHMLPWQDEIDWNEICVVVKNESQYDKLDKFLKNMSEDRVKEIQNKIKAIYPLYFTIPAVYNQIIKRIVT